MAATDLVTAFEEARALDAPLNERLGAYARSLRELNPVFATAVDRLIERLRDGSAISSTPKEGERMPAFLLPDHSGRLLALEELLRSGPVAVTFARGHWCPYCRIAVSALAEIGDAIEQLGGQIVAIVPDRQQYAAKLKADAHAGFPILSDVDNAYAVTLGLAFWVGDELQRLMQSRDIRPDEAQGNESWFVPVPATFILARDGTIVARHVDPDYRKRMEIEAVLSGLKAAALRQPA